MTKFYSTWRTHLGALLLMMTVFSFNVNATIHEIPSDADSLEHFIETDYDTAWFAGDTIMLTDVEYTVNNVIDIYRTITIMGDPDLPSAPVLNLEDNGFRVQDDTLDVCFNYFDINGLQSDGDYSPYALYYNTIGATYFGNIVFKDMDISGFKYMLFLDAGKHSVYDSLIIDNVILHDFQESGNWNFVIDPKINYLEYLSITNSTFYNLPLGFLKNPDYNGNGTLDITKDWTIDHCTFYKVGGNGKSFIQINDPTDGSVDFTFTNNIVSKMYDTTAFLPFYINESAGDFYFGYSTFNNYEVDINTDYNLSTVASYSNVDTSNIFTDYPLFADTTNYDFTLPDSSYAYTAATDGGPIGDPRWSEKIIKVVSISALLETVITGNDYQMEATVNVGDSIDDGTVTWSVLNGTGYATIDANGLLSADTAGKVTVIATSNYKSIYADSLDIIIRDTTFVSGISLTGLETDMITETTAITNSGNSIYIKASVSPGSATNDSVTWAISDESLATFTESSYKMIKLTATGIACGTVTVTATAKDGSGISGTIDISLEKQVSATSVALSSESTTVAVGGTLQILSDFLPAATCDQTLTWTSTDEDVATVDSTGIVTGVAEGTADIIARTSNYKKDTITITVGTSSVNSDLESTNTISVYPNPATDIISINNESAAKVNITNLVGRIVLTETIDPNATINISSLKSGIYFISIETTDKINSVRFIKK